MAAQYIGYPFATTIDRNFAGRGLPKSTYQAVLRIGFVRWYGLQRVLEVSSRGQGFGWDQGGMKERSSSRGCYNVRVGCTVFILSLLIPGKIPGHGLSNRENVRVRVRNKPCCLPGTSTKPCCLSDSYGGIIQGVQGVEFGGHRFGWNQGGGEIASRRW